MKMFGVEVKLQVFSASALGGGKWSTSRSSRFTPSNEHGGWTSWWREHELPMFETKSRCSPCLDDNINMHFWYTRCYGVELNGHGKDSVHVWWWNR
jgi:hypothetical protein